MNIRTLFPGVVGYSNLTETPLYPVEELEKAVSAKSIEWYETVSAPDGEADKAGVNYDFRRGLNFGLAPELFDHPDPLIANFKNVSEFLYNVTKPAVDHYKSVYYSYDAVDYMGWVLLKYRVGDFFSAHTDASHDYPRQLSLVYYLNDDYEGGEIHFPHINLMVKPLAGELIIFPANYLFLHAAKEVTSGIKYSAINFIN